MDAVSTVRDTFDGHAMLGPGAARLWLRAGLAVAAVAWGANQFAPLVVLYRDQRGLSSTTIEALFGVYAAGLVPALLVCGPLADRHGRRRVVLSAVVLSGLASLCLVGGARATALLYAGRLLAGVASGAAFGAGAAWIKELSTTTADDGSGARRVTVTMTAGFGAGPLASGLLAQWAPSPATVVYLPHLALVVLAVAVAAAAPDTRPAASRDAGTAPSRLRHPRYLRVVLPLAPWVFGSAAVALAYLPDLAAHRAGGHPLAFAAVVTSLPALAGIAVQPAARRVAARGSTMLVSFALGVVVLGFALAAAAGGGRLELVLAACAVLGAGYGACQVCGLTEIIGLASDHELAGLTAAYQAVSYLGFGLPYVLAAAAPLATPRILLLWVAGLAALTLVVTTVNASRTQAGPK